MLVAVRMRISRLLYCFVVRADPHVPAQTRAKESDQCTDGPGTRCLVVYPPHGARVEITIRSIEEREPCGEEGWRGLMCSTYTVVVATVNTKR